MKFEEIYNMFEQIKDLEKDKAQIERDMLPYRIKLNYGTDNANDRKRYAELEKELQKVSYRIYDIMNIEISNMEESH